MFSSFGSASPLFSLYFANAKYKARFLLVLTIRSMPLPPSGAVPHSSLDPLLIQLPRRGGRLRGRPHRGVEAGTSTNPQSISCASQFLTRLLTCTKPNSPAVVGRPRRRPRRGVEDRDFHHPQVTQTPSQSLTQQCITRSEAGSAPFAWKVPR